MTERLSMDMYYAKAYARERLEAAHARRLAAAVTRVECDDIGEPRRRFDFRLLARDLDPGPVCCTA